MHSLLKTLGCIGAAAALSLLLLGCPADTTNDTGNTGGTGSTDTSDTLNETQTEALTAALDSVESLTTSVGTTQGATQGEDSQASLSTTNTCPAVSFQAATAAVVDASLTLDFGDGCNALGSDDYFCSGQASGEFSSTLAVEFTALSCNNNSLDGTVDFSFDRDGDDVNFSGGWDLVATQGDATLRTEGEGDATYVAEDAATTINVFTGSIRTHDGETYGFDLATIATSYATYGNFIPFDGELTLSGATIESFTVRFDANSPTTGDVQVSVNGGDFVDYNLFEGL